MRFKIWWRRLRGRCQMCGGRREQHAHACWHCSNPALCHRCGKRVNFMTAYGGRIR